MDSFRQWPWMSDADADTLKAFYDIDPAAAKQFEAHLLEEARSDKRFRDISLPLEALGDAT